MADKLRMDNEVRELKIGQSFTNTKSGAFHAVRYDFKPASVDINKIATVDIGASNQVTVNVPHLDGAGLPQTVFKGSHRPFTKECVLIFDRITGEITLEKLSSNLQVKKTRSEAVKPQLPQERAPSAASRPQTPPIGQRQSNKTRVTSGSRRPDRPITQLATLRASPNYVSPTTNKSDNRERDRERNGDSSTLSSLPMIGVDDFDEPPRRLPVVPTVVPPPPVVKAPLSSHSDSEPDNVAEMSDSSSSSNSSSDSDSEHETRLNGHNTSSAANVTNGSTGGGGGKLPSLPTTLLNDDLCLSESGSDYD